MIVAEEESCELFAPYRDGREVFYGHGGEVGGVSLDTLAWNEIMEWHRELVIAHPQVGVHESIDLAGRGCVVDSAPARILGLAISDVEALREPPGEEPCGSTVGVPSPGVSRDEEIELVGVARVSGGSIGEQGTQSEVVVHAAVGHHHRLPRSTTIAVLELILSGQRR